MEHHPQIRPELAAVRLANGRFAPGKSGNPSGRPRLVADIVELARATSLRAFERLVQLVESHDERVALAASTALLDRAWGRPAQCVAVTQSAPEQSADRFVEVFESATRDAMTAIRTQEAFNREVHAREAHQLDYQPESEDGLNGVSDGEDLGAQVTERGSNAVPVGLQIGDRIPDDEFETDTAPSGVILPSAWSEK